MLVRFLIKIHWISKRTIFSLVRLWADATATTKTITTTTEIFLCVSLLSCFLSLQFYLLISCSMLLDSPCAYHTPYNPQCKYTMLAYEDEEKKEKNTNWIRRTKKQSNNNKQTLTKKAKSKENKHMCACICDALRICSCECLTIVQCTWKQREPIWAKIFGLEHFKVELLHFNQLSKFCHKDFWGK